MRKILFATTTAAAALLVGCSSSHNGQVTYRSDGTKVYSLDSRPQSEIVSDSPLMEGVYGSRDNPGKFTGNETGDRLGLATTARNSATSSSSHTQPPQVGTGIVPPGAGTLGQAGIQAGAPVSSSSILSSSVNPPDVVSTPTLAEPLTRNAGVRIDSSSAVGRPGGAEIGGGSSSISNNTLPRPVLSSNGQLNSLNPNSTGVGTGAPNTGLAMQIREALQVGRPDSISTLTPDRVQNLEVEAVNGNVTLRGVARTEVEKLMIENKVARLPGVSSVNNQLRVMEAPEDGTTNPAGPDQRR